MNSKKKINVFSYLKKRNAKRFSIFIAIAFIFLIISKLSNDYKQYIKLKIVLSDVEEEIVLKADSLNTIEALVQAKGFSLVPYIFKSSKTIVLDTKRDINTKQGEFIFDVQKNKYRIDEQLGSSYKILSLKPDTLVMPYSRRASKYVSIDLNSNISYAPGFDIKGNYAFSLDSVKIIGPEEKINNIQTITTKELKLSNVNTSIEETVELTNISGLEVFPTSIEVSAEVQRFTEGKIEVPVSIINKPESFSINYFPKTVTISYYVDLDSYNAIKANDFRVICDYDQVDESQSYLVPQIVKRPELIKRISIKQKRIDFIKL